MPDGLGISSSGLISGTPTNLAVDSTITFEVVDSFCEEPDPRMFPPRASMRTTAVTQIATVIGYDPFVGSVPPKRYKQAAFSGEAISFIFDSFSDTLRYSEWVVFSGTSTIDINGTVLTNHSKAVEGRNGDSSQPWYSRGNLFQNSSGDVTGLQHEFEFTTIPDPFHRRVLTPPLNPDSQVPYPDAYFPNAPTRAILQPITIPVHEQISTPYNFPPGSGIYDLIPLATIFSIQGKWINFSEGFDYTVTVSDEYTDADSLSVAATVTSSSNVSRNEPRKVGYVSRYTTVSYIISLTNLVSGQVYNVVIPLHGSDGSNSSILHTFTAVSTIHSITGTAPTPPAWVSVEVRPPLVSFA